MRRSESLQHAVDVARQRATAAGLAMVTAHHLLAAVLEEAEGREAAEGAGASVSRLLAVAQSGTDPVIAPTLAERVLSWGSGMVASHGCRRALSTASAHMRRASQPEVGTVDVLAALCRDAKIGPGLRDAGLSRLALLRYHCHGSTAGAAEAPQSAECVVVIHNDHYTEMDSVVRILREAFEMTPSEAFQVMLKVHIDGKRALQPLPTSEAVRRVSTAYRMAEAIEAPLRLTLEAAGA